MPGEHATWELVTRTAPPALADYVLDYADYHDNTATVRQITDAHHDRSKAAGAEITRELNDTDYGSRAYSAFDPVGYWWSFGTFRS